MKKSPRAFLRARMILFAVPAAFAAVLLGGSQSPANAGLLDDLLSGPGSITGPIVGGIGGVGCEAAAQYPAAQQGLCLLKSAHIKYRTTYLRPDGTELVRSVNAMVALPSVINADDDLLPEGSALLAIKSTNTFTLRFDRALLETGPVPVKFEVIVPMPGADPKRDNVYIGFDARQGRMPTRWNGRIVLLENTDTTTHLGLEIERTGAAPRLKVIGGLFDGSIGNRIDPIAATVDPQPVPASLAASLRIVDDGPEGDELTISANASSPTSVDATLENVEGPKRQDVTAYIEDLPTTSTTVRVHSPTDTEQHVYYTAEQRMPEVRFTSELREAGVLTDRLKVALEDLPTKLEFHQPRPGVGSLATTGGAIGKTKVSINDGFFAPFPDNDGPHVTYLYDGVLGAEVPEGTEPPEVPNALDLEIDDLTAAAFDASGDFTVDVTTAPGPGEPRQDLRGYVKDHVNIVDATVFQIPAHVKVIATDAGEIRYDGHGQTVPEITAHLEAIAGTLSPETRYTQVDARILDLPAKVTVSVSPDNNHVVAKADPDDTGLSVGSLRMHARDAVSSCEAELLDDRGAVFVDTPQNACLAARFDGLRTADVQMEPLKVTVKAAHKQDLVLRGRVDEAGDGVNAIGVLDGRITQMPKEFDFQVLPGTVDFGSTTKLYRLRANDGTPSLTLTGTDLPASFGNGFLDFAITQLPKEVDAYLPDQGMFRQFQLHAPDGVGKAELELADGPTHCRDQIVEESGIAFSDTAADKCIGVRISGVRHATLELYPLELHTETTATQKFQIVADIDDLDDAVDGPGHIDATIDELPTELDIVGSTGAIPDAPNSETMDLAIDMEGEIDSLKFIGTGLPATFPKRNMEIRVKGLHDETNLRLPKDGDVAALQVDSVVAPIELAYVQLNDDNLPTVLAADTDSVVVDGEDLAVQVHDIKRARFQSRLGEGFRYDGTLFATITHSTDPKPLHVKVDKGQSHVTVDVADPPEYLSFRREGTYSPNSFSPDRPAMIYLDGGLPDVKLHIGDGPDSSVDVEAREIPDGLRLCLWSGGGTTHQVMYSDPVAVDRTWCYQPEKKPIPEGGDPFTVFDTVQFKVSLDSGVENLDTPILLDKLVIRSKDNEGVGTTTVTQGKAGVMTFAYGQGALWGAADDPARVAMFGGDDDNASWEGVYDSDPGYRNGLHFYSDTDHHGFAAALQYDWNPGGGDDSDLETTNLYSLKPLVADNKITVLDMDGAPGEVYQRGSIGICSTTWAQFRLVFPSGVTIVPETLADYLNCPTS